MARQIFSCPKWGCPFNTNLEPSAMAREIFSGCKCCCPLKNVWNLLSWPGRHFPAQSVVAPLTRIWNLLPWPGRYFLAASVVAPLRMSETFQQGQGRLARASQVQGVCLLLMEGPQGHHSLHSQGPIGVNPAPCVYKYITQLFMTQCRMWGAHDGWKCVL